MKKFHVQQGFTLIELIVVMGVIATLVAFTTTNLLGYQRRLRLSSTLATLVADIQTQRIRAMNGDTQGRGTVDSYGIYLAQKQYVLFHGSTYNSSATDNITIPYDAPIELSSTTFSGSQIVFTKGSGEISSFVANQNTVTMVNTSDNSTSQLVFNQYGTITAGAP